MSQSILHRLGGLVCLIGAGGFGWFFILKPLQAAQAHAAEISYNNKIFILAPALVVFGLFFLIAGDRWPYRDVEKQRPTTAGWILLAVTAIAAIAGFWWFDQQFKALGYSNG